MKTDYRQYFEKNYPLLIREEYKASSLSRADKKILCEMGFPVINHMPPFLYSFNTSTESSIYLKNFPGYIVIGYDEWDMPVCVNQKGEIVIAVDGEGEFFINSSMESFFSCLAVYLSYEDRLSETDEMNIPISERLERSEMLAKERKKVVNALRKELKQVDAKAFGNPDFPWAFHLEELEEGVL